MALCHGSYVDCDQAHRDMQLSNIFLLKGVCPLRICISLSIWSSKTLDPSFTKSFFFFAFESRLQLLQINGQLHKPFERKAENMHACLGERTRHVNSYLAGPTIPGPPYNALFDQDEGSHAISFDQMRTLLRLILQDIEILVKACNETDCKR